ncbi:MAG: LPS export ABC transporter periplasmic protein LptC [Alphaproteobacteria bacterium]|nr:LPS export ABC transporter periplasmic protein LptC [Alphaproteobacteria bacterium]
MFDLKQLDNLFNDENLKKQGDNVNTRRQKLVRTIKIVFPAVAAALIGMLAVFPSLQERIDISAQIAKPTKQELEKLHMENTVLYVTDKSNRVNSFKAEKIDETEPSSQVLKIVSPVGKIPSSDGNFIDIVAPWGFYDRNASLISLNENVDITYSDGMKAKTEEMFFDSKASKAYGLKPIEASGKYGLLKSQGFEYHTDSEYALFNGNAEIHIDESMGGEKNDIFARDKIEFFKSELRLVATGKAQVKRTSLKINGDVLTAVFKKNADNKTEISDFYGQGNVVVDNYKNKVFADKLKAFFNNLAGESVLEKVEMTGNVKTKTNEGEIHAQRGIYYPKSSRVELYDDVVIIKDGNSMRADYAQTDLNTGISKMGNPAQKQKGRVSGVIYEDSFRKKR